MILDALNPFTSRLTKWAWQALSTAFVTWH